MDEKGVEEWIGQRGGREWEVHVSVDEECVQ